MTNSNISLSGLRALRVLRPLRTISNIKELKKSIINFIWKNALPLILEKKIKDVIIIILCKFLLFSLIILNAIAGSILFLQKLKIKTLLTLNL